jgi:hypothetical protein
MVLDNKTIEKIKALVYEKPRSISELAIAINKNWRTADRYVQDIMLKTGTIKLRTFRGGSRGALKVVYWNNTEKIYATDVQEKLFKQIEMALDKANFSPFEIYQYVDADKRNGYFEEIKDESTYDYDIKSLAPHFETAEKEICIFAGNLAFIHLQHKKKKILEYMKDCVGRKIIIKIITNIHIVDLANVEAVMALNSGLKEPLVEIRHEVSPLRAYIFDDNILKMGDLKLGQKKEGQIQNKVALYYEIKDESWIDWMKKLFWKKFQNAIQAKLRVENLKTLRRKK